MTSPIVLTAMTVTAEAYVSQPGEIAYNGVKIGGDSSIALIGVSGWLSSSLTSSDVARPDRHGYAPGRARAASRVIEIEFAMRRYDPEAFRALRDAIAYDENPQEKPLVLWVGTDEPRRVMARCMNADIPTDHEFSLGYQRGVLQFVATDPKHYSIDLREVSITLPKPAESGLAFPLAFPLDFGEGSTGGYGLIRNRGNAAVWPTWEIRGPVTGPIITNYNTGERLVFAPTLTIAAGQTLTIDTDRRRVTLQGVSRQNQLLTRQWFPLLPGETTAIGFTSANGYHADARLVCLWRDAWSS